MGDFGQPGGLESLDSTRTLASLRMRVEQGDSAAGVQYIETSFSVFRGVMIALFVLLFVSALMGIISGGFLLVAADTEDQSGDWKSRARSMGGADIAIMFIFLAFSAYALYILVRYEKSMGYMLHRLATGRGGIPVIKTTQEHLAMENRAMMPPERQQFAAVMPTGAAMSASTQQVAPPQQPASGFVFE